MSLTSRSMMALVSAPGDFTAMPSAMVWAPNTGVRLRMA
jgi:hypothetical protein